MPRSSLTPPVRRSWPAPLAGRQLSLARWALLLAVPLLVLQGAGCRSLEQETRRKQASVQRMPETYRKRLPKLIPFAIRRAVKIKPAMFKVGSGCVISPDGWIATAAHVVRGVSDVDVILSNGVSLPGRVMAISDGNDFALVKVSARRLPFFRFGRRPKLGQHLLAIGVAYRNGPQDDAGAVSAGRCIYPRVNIPGEVGTYYHDSVFHSAPIFPGDSGGPLIDLDGRLVGVHGGFSADNASVAPSIEAIWKRIRSKKGRFDPAGALRGKPTPVHWAAIRPRSFAESTQWTTRSVIDTLVAVYAPGRRAFVQSVLDDMRVRYLDLRKSDRRTDDELVRAMLADVFRVLDRERKKPGRRKSTWVLPSRPRHLAPLPRPRRRAA